MADMSKVKLPDNSIYNFRDDRFIYEKSVSASNVATFSDGADNVPLKSLTLDINPTQDLHGYDSPWVDGSDIFKTPYLSTPINGTAPRYGNYIYDKLVGGTVAFNQLSNPNNANGSLGSVSVSNNTITFTATTKSIYQYISQAIKFISGHKMLISFDVTLSENETVGIGYGGAVVHTKSCLANEKKQLAYIDNFSSNATNVYLYTGRTAGLTVGATAKVENWKVIDLTAMFGSTIADYIYSLNQGTAGAGVAWFRNLFPEDYYAYNVGELMSVKTSAHVMKNSSNVVIGNYALDNTLELRGIPKLDTNNNLYYDGDTYASNGTVTRRYGIVNMNTLTFIGYSTTHNIYYASLDGSYRPETDESNEIAVCNRYAPSTSISISGTMSDMSWLISGGYIYIRDTVVEDATALNTKLATNSYLLYRLATPTTETASSFTNPQVCVSNGSAEYVDNRAVPIPVGHETYQANICPITGVSSVNVTRCGKNLLEKGVDLQSRIPVNKSNCFFIKQGTYTVSFGSATNFTSFRWCVYLFDPDGTALLADDYRPGIGFSSTGAYWRFGSNIPITDNTKEITITKDCFIRFAFSLGDTSSTSVMNDTQLELGTMATTYEPYITPTTHHTDFGQTVYGEELNATTGVLTITHNYIEYDGSEDENWNYVNTGYSISKPKGCSATSSTVFCYANQAVQTTNNSVPNGTIRIGASNVITRLGTGNNDIPTFKAWLASNPLQLVYPLATPITIQLDPIEVRTLLGQNNIFHDANGTTACTYRVDTPLVNAINDISREIAIEEIGTIDTTVTEDSDNLITSGAVWTAIDELPEPMIFRGSVGTGGTITTLPTDGSAEVGDTYKVITDGTYDSQTAKVGDTFICDSKTSSANTWVLIPSGDEPSGTVTNIATGVGLTGGPVTTTGTIKVKLKSETALTSTAQSATEVANRVFAVVPDSNGDLAVVVPDPIDDSTNSSTKTWSSEKIARETNITSQISGSVCSFNDGADGTPIQLLKASVSGTGCNVKNDIQYGGDVNFNQFVQNGNFVDSSGWAERTQGCFSVSNGEGTITAVVKSNANQVYQPANAVVGHKYIVGASLKKNAGTFDSVLIGFFSSTTRVSVTSFVPTTNYERYYSILPLESSAGSFRFSIYGNVALNDSFSIKDLICIDLTQMFGEAKADEIYAMEQATAGSGVAYVRSLLYKDYYAYNTGVVTNISAINGDTDDYVIYPISWATEVGTITSGTMTINADGTIDITSSGTTTRLASTVDVTTYLGTNNIWVDTGNISELIYYKNSKLEIDITNLIFSALTKAAGKLLEATLTSGNTTVTISDSSITTNSIIDDIFTTIPFVAPIDISITTGQIVLTFVAQNSDMGVRVVIK